MESCSVGLNVFLYSSINLEGQILRAVICFLWVNGFQLDVCLLNNDCTATSASLFHSKTCVRLMALTYWKLEWASPLELFKHDTSYQNEINKEMWQKSSIQGRWYCVLELQHQRDFGFWHHLCRSLFNHSHPEYLFSKGKNWFSDFKSYVFDL